MHVCSASVLLHSGTRWHRGREMKGDGLLEERGARSHPGTFLLLSTQVPGTVEAAGRKWRRLVGLEGLRDAVLAAVCGLRSGLSVVTGLRLSGPGAGVLC